MAHDNIDLCWVCRLHVLLPAWLGRIIDRLDRKGVGPHDRT